MPATGEPIKLLPSEYLGSSYTVTGDTLSIDVTELEGVGLTGAAAEEVSGISIDSTSADLVIGSTYTITFLGTSTEADWTAVGWDGASNDDEPQVGDTFTAIATGAGSGTGQVTKGDIRTVLLGILDAVYEKYREYSAENNDPNRMIVTRTSTYNDVDDVFTRTYQLVFQTEVSGVTIREEPAS